MPPMDSAPLPDVSAVQHLPSAITGLSVEEVPLPDVVGTLHVVGPIASTHLGRERSILVWLPSSYASQPDRVYPVIYMQDGQNLFSAAMAVGAEWRVDETLERLARVGLEAIVVGIPNVGENRLHEYVPGDNDSQAGPAGDRYLRFLTDEVMPFVEARYRISPARSETGIAGSSLGAVIALYGFYRYSEKFGFVAALSPALWAAERELQLLVRESRPQPGRIYLDISIQEGEEHVGRVHQLHALLLEQGSVPGKTLLYVEDEDTQHDESAWARRLRTALYFLLPARAHGRHAS